MFKVKIHEYLKPGKNIDQVMNPNSNACSIKVASYSDRQSIYVFRVTVEILVTILKITVIRLNPVFELFLVLEIHYYSGKIVMIKRNRGSNPSEKHCRISPKCEHVKMKESSISPVEVFKT